MSLLYVLLIIPIIGIFLISTIHSFYPVASLVPRVKYMEKTEGALQQKPYLYISEGDVLNADNKEDSFFDVSYYKQIAFITTILNLIVSLIIYMLFDFSNNQFQFIQENLDLSFYDIYLGVDGVSIYFVLLTTIIMPIALVSNWNSIINNVKSYLIIILLLETLLLAVFLVLDVLLFYIFFESILPPLFILIGLFGSSNKVRASFYIFLYTLLGSLFLLLSILTMSSIVGTTYFDVLFKSSFDYTTQMFLFCGIFIAFAVKTPTIFLNS